MAQSQQKRIRGWIGEQSFEIAEGFEYLDRISEAMVYSSVYRTEREGGATADYAARTAQLAVESFKKSKDAPVA